MVPAEKLIQQYLKTDQYTITRLKGDGSDRGIFRVASNLTSVILIQSVNIDENKNFVKWSDSLKNYLFFPAD